jgi:all-trans-retinol 13,14-reductase
MLNSLGMLGVWEDCFNMNGWDTIVIGAGIGGLTAAAHLSKAGLRVLVLDRNPHPGGTAYVYHRKGFTFPMGPLGFSQPELIQETLRDLDIGEDVKLSRVFYRLRAFDLDLPLSLSIPEMIKELSKSFRSDAEGITKFFKIVESVTRTSRLSFLRIPKISASEYLLPRIKDRRLRRILGSIGTREPYSGLPLLASMWDLMCQTGIWYPKEGMQLFSDRFVKSIKRDSGEIRLSTEVSKIRVEAGKAQGVTLRDGTEIDSGSVISNADYKKTFINLLNPEVVPPAWYDAVSKARQTGSIFQVCLGIDREKADLSAFQKVDRIIYRRNHEEFSEGGLNWDDSHLDPELLARQELEVSLWGKGDDTLSSKGGAVIVIRAEAKYSHFVRYRSISSRRVSEYQDDKTRLAHALIHEIEHFIPGLEKAILVMDVATPLTFEDQGGRSQGAVAGWSWDYEDFQNEKPRELIQTPIKRLYMAGYQAFSALFLGGVPTAMESGKRAARAVLEGASSIERILIPGVK